MIVIVFNQIMQQSQQSQFVNKKNKIKRLHVKKAPGFDIITAEVLKQLPYKSLLKLAYIFNPSDTFS